MKRPLLSLRLGIISGLCLCLIAGGGIWFYSSQRQDLIQEAETTLETISRFKVDNIVKWRAERLGDGRVIMENPIANEVLAEWNRTHSQKTKEKLEAAFRSLQRSYGYENVTLVDAKGIILLSLDDSLRQLAREAENALAEALEERKPILTDLHFFQDGTTPHMDVIAPLFMGSGDSALAIGALVLCILPNEFLYPLIQSWPVPSSTAETLLVRREGDEAVFLNELRFRKDASLKLKIPLSQIEIPAAKAALGETGAFRGKDYRGVDVFSVLNKIPNSPWFMVAKVDAKEALSIWREKSSFIVAVILSLLTALITLAGFLWQRANKAHIKKLYETEISRAAERERAEETIRAISARQQALLDATPDIIMEVDVNKIYTWANPAGIEFFGEDVLGKEAAYYFEGEQDTYDAVDPIFGGRENVIYVESWQRRKDGQKRWLAWWCRVLKDKQGNVTGALSSARDITKRKQMEEALRVSEDKFKYVFDHSVIGKSITLPSGEINVNRAFCEMLGYSHKELKDRKWQEISLPDDNELTQREINFLLSGEKDSVRFVKRYVHKNGSVVWADVSSSLRRDQEGKPIYFMTAVNDITDQKRAEEEIRRLNAELEQRVQDRTDELQVANKELEAFSYSVSHDLRAPLRAVDGFSRILLDEYAAALPPEAKRYAELVRLNTLQMRDLVDNLLAFSRSGRQAMNKDRVEPVEVVREALDLLRGEQEGRSVKVTVGELPTCQADRMLLKQTFINLLSNALKFTRKRDPAIIEVGCLREDGANVFFVRDNGVGFDMRYVGKLFDVFQRLHRTEDYEGTGVGLAIVQRIVHRHGGRIWAEAGLDKGATFYFTLKGEHP